MSRRDHFVFQVRPRQVWSVADMFGRTRMRLRVVSHDGRDVQCIRILPDGTDGPPHKIKHRTLSHGYRTARIEEEAPGMPVQVRPDEGPTRTAQEKTASDFRREKAPRGMPKRTEPTETEIRIDKMRKGGETYEVIGRTLGVRAETVRAWHQNFRDIELLKQVRAS